MTDVQTMKNQQLISETTSQLASRFSPNVIDIKKAIDTLLDKEYIERAENSRDTFNYLGEDVDFAMTSTLTHCSYSMSSLSWSARDGSKCIVGPIITKWSL